MSEGANSVTQVCENSLTSIEDDPELLPPRTISHTTRRSRFGTGNIPLSPYIIIDGRKLRSALALSKKRPPRRVSFPANDNFLVTGYLEPTDPWKHAENVNRDDLISAYKESCKKHNTDPLEIVMSQLEGLDVSSKYSEEFNLKGQMLDPNHCESLEEIFKRIQFSKIDLEATSLNDESSVILFDMLEYYESTKHLNISFNPNIGLHGWQACANMIRKAQCLEHLEAKSVILNEQYMNILSRALRLVCHLHILKLENCGLSGRSIVTLVAALKMNKGIRELYLADNDLDFYDAIQIGSLLRFNNHLQLLDISNNNIQDDGVRDILEGLINQINEDKDGKGLNILVLWNNQLTKKSSPYFARIIALSKTIETLNIGKNMLTDELIFTIKEALEKNHVLLQLGMQSIDLTCDGIVTLSEIIKINTILQRIDLRNNDIQLTGMETLCSAMKENKNITKIDLDENPKFRKVGSVTETLHQYMQLVAEIQLCCSQNEQNRIIKENGEGSENSYHNSLCGTNSRKISLTCQTLPCSLPTVIPIQSDESRQSFFEPKRINGGRLRSPALSPNSSPITSPVPTPSRSRFVVSRVPETLRSTEFTAPLSPSVTLSSESPSTYLTSTASGSSRFRVSVVESASIVPLPKPVVSSEADLIPDLNFKVSTVESNDTDDSDNVLKLEKDNDQNIRNFHNKSSSVTCSISDTIKETCTSSIHEVGNIEVSNTDKQFTKATIQVKSVDDRNLIALKQEEYCDAQNDRPNMSTDLQNISTIRITDMGNSCNEDTKNIKTLVNINTENNRSECSVQNSRSINISREYVDETISANITRNERTKMQSETTQCSTEFSSDSASISKLWTRSTFQDSTISGIMSEDKFNRKRQELSVSMKNRIAKSIAIFQLLNLESLRNIFPLFKLIVNLNVSDQSHKSYPKIVTQIFSSRNCKNDFMNIRREYITYNNENNRFTVETERRKTSVSTLNSNELLFQDIRVKNYVVLINKDTVLLANHIASNVVGDSYFKFIHDILIPASKRKMSLPKFIIVHDCCILQTAGNNRRNCIRNGNIQEILNKVGFILIKRICDETLTNSINFNSDNSSLFYSIMYDIANISDMLTVNIYDSLHNFIILKFNEKNDKNNVFNVDNKQNNLVRFLCNKRYDDLNIHSKSLIKRNTLKVNVRTNCLNNKVTKIHHIANNDKKAFTDIHNILRNKIDGIDIYYNSHDSLSCNCIDWQSTIVNNISKVKRLLKMNFVHKDINFELSDENADLYSSVVYFKDITDTSKLQEIVRKFAMNDDKYFDVCNITEMEMNDSHMMTTINSTAENANMLSLRTYPCTTNFNTFIPRDLIFSVADNSINETSNKRNLLSTNISNNWSDETMNRNTSLYVLPQIPDSSVKLITKTSENIHRDSKTSIHENKNFPLNYNVQRSVHLFDNQEFKEDHTENDSECFPMYTKAYSAANSKKNRCLLEENSAVSDDTSENMYIFTKFGTNIAQHVKCTTSDAICDMTHKYFNTIKCAVATTICSKATVNTRDDMTVEIISDKSINVVKPSSVIHKTSTK
ncbi:uncharacterized protein LOC143184960 [Calliopsis andreniformis]|uniref:uncharacterized protein LOC143184960 n=1 Tax=Calliopsis andreniformis TaxID=337506 RepID=UPI003FCEBE5A